MHAICSEAALAADLVDGEPFCANF